MIRINTRLKLILSFLISFLLFCVAKNSDMGISLAKKSVLFIILILFLDQLLKIWIKTHFVMGQELHIFGRYGMLHFIENNGMAFGMEMGGKTRKTDPEPVQASGNNRNWILSQRTCKEECQYRTYSGNQCHYGRSDWQYYRQCILRNDLQPEYLRSGCGSLSCGRRLCHIPSGEGR